MQDTVSIFKRVKKSTQAPFGIVEIKNINKNEPCVICFGGDTTNTNKDANGYAKILEESLKGKSDKPVPVYSIKYNFETFSSGANNRAFTFLKYRTKALDVENKTQIDSFFSNIDNLSDANPKYIDDLYKSIIQDRISSKKGKEKIKTDEAAKNIRKITFVAHCHGGWTAFKLEEKMQKEMEKLGYSPEERKLIQQQMLIIGHAPACPLGKSKSQFISFISAKDSFRPKPMNILEHYIEEKITEDATRFYAEKENNTETLKLVDRLKISPAYFGPRQGNLFLIKERYTSEKSEFYIYSNPKEHEFKHFPNSQNPDGELLTTISDNILINGVNNSLQQTQKQFIPLPSLNKLILGKNKNGNDDIIASFKDMLKNGKSFRQEVNQFALEWKKTTRE